MTFSQSEIRTSVAAVIAISLLGVCVAQTSCSTSPHVRLVRVLRQNLKAALTTNGKVEPLLTRSVRAEFATFVEKIEITEGEVVQRGQSLMRLNVDLGYELAQNRSELAAAQADLSYMAAGGLPDTAVQLNEDLKRAEANVRNLERLTRSLTELVAKQAASPDELSQNRAALAQAKVILEGLSEKRKNAEMRRAMDKEHASYRLREAQERMRQIDDTVRAANVLATIGGTVVDLPARIGNYVKVGDLLAQIADLRHLQVRAFVDEPELGRITLHERVRVTWDGRPEQVWMGQIERLPTRITKQDSRNVGEITFSIDNSGLDLTVDAHVDVEVIVKEVPQALVVPRETVRHDKGNQFVFVYDKGIIHRRVVKVGSFNATNYEVLSGLSDKDKVIVSYDLEPGDGMHVQAEEPQ